MKTVKVSELSTKEQWIEFIDITKELTLKDLDGALDIYGEDEEVYLVINLYQNESSSIEYFFKPLIEQESRMALLSLLEENNFSLSALLNLILTSSYIEEEMGQVLIFDQIKIFRERFSDLKR
ncbi:hypothetical protein [Litoribrevibacter albus]|uniref:Uncharacterized protein n=1 Tax=Litoribrevibacter albus TaxID=1473156 RepID=A0AA37S6B3_9GAMM|nr:hypothetical protein [Litoribrevibacter albus]GLQ29955.1 hypothetical protein GCM10007876_04330 [Litoribrevibacter albus]